jgi:hypothetical protein
MCLESFSTRLSLSNKSLGSEPRGAPFNCRSQPMLLRR